MYAPSPAGPGREVPRPRCQPRAGQGAVPGGFCPVGGLHPLRERSLLPGGGPGEGLPAPVWPLSAAVPPAATHSPCRAQQRVGRGLRAADPPSPRSPSPRLHPPPPHAGSSRGSRQSRSARGSAPRMTQLRVAVPGRGGDGTPAPQRGAGRCPPGCQLCAPRQRCQRCRRPVLSHSGGSRPAAGGGPRLPAPCSPTGRHPRGWQHPRVPGMGWGWPQPPQEPPLAAGP